MITVEIQNEGGMWEIYTRTPLGTWTDSCSMDVAISDEEMFVSVIQTSIAEAIEAEEDQEDR